MKKSYLVLLSILIVIFLFWGIPFIYTMIEANAPFHSIGTMALEFIVGILILIDLRRTSVIMYFVYFALALFFAIRLAQKLADKKQIKTVAIPLILLLLLLLYIFLRQIYALN
jgi:hypothetical protein